MSEVIGIRVSITEEQQDKLIDLAIRRGWLREEPRKRWTKRERIEAIKAGLDYLLRDM